jgi:nucleotide-binding universal stress UspA family protein
MTAAPVVAGTDGSEESLHAVAWAAREAVLHDAPLRIVSAAALLPRMIEHAGAPGLPTVASSLRADRDRALDAAARRGAEAAPGLLVDTDTLSGPPARAVSDAGSGASMLVVGSRGGGAFTAMILGSVSRYAAGHASCPVVVVREETTAAQRQIVVGIGDPAGSSAALAFAFREAALRKASVLAVHAWDSPRGDIGRATLEMAAPGAHARAEETAGRQLRALLAQFEGEHPGVQASYDFVYAHPGRALVGLSARADLVVLGRRHADGALPGPGAVRHAVLNHAHGPVVIVPSA